MQTYYLRGSGNCLKNNNWSLGEDIVKWDWLDWLFTGSGHWGHKAVLSYSLYLYISIIHAIIKIGKHENI